MESMTDREFAYLRSIRKLYTPQDLLTVQKALAPQTGEVADFSELVLKISQTHAEVKVTHAPDQPQSNQDFVDAVAKEV